MKNKMYNYDILIAGCGIAGLTAAIDIAAKRSDLKILLVSKNDILTTNTYQAQGGIAAVLDQEKDTFESHIYDTLSAGDGLCDENVVNMVVRRAPACISTLMEWGIAFDSAENGALKVAREGGHSHARVAHYKDISGKQIAEGLWAKAQQYENIHVWSGCLLTELITSRHYTLCNDEASVCYGALLLDPESGVPAVVLARNTLLATGGAGALYKTTTNPAEATGDGIALAARAGAEIKNLAYVQFHPTAMLCDQHERAFLLSEALRGEGGVLRNHRQEAFMKKYAAEGDLACRDVVARAVMQEMDKAGKDFVYLDVTHLSTHYLKTHFPAIYANCIKHGIEPGKDMIPVQPAAHYFCGGIQTNMHGETSIKGLFACGECAYTGLHGANRLASNSLLEALVFALQCSTTICRKIDTYCMVIEEPCIEQLTDAYHVNEQQIWAWRHALQEVITDDMGVIKSKRKLDHAYRFLQKLNAFIKAISCVNTHKNAAELYNMATVAGLMLEDAYLQQENKGVFFNTSLSAESMTG